MRPLRILACSLFLLTSCVTEPGRVAGPAEELGELSGAPYAVKIPTGWNGDLVLVMHGYEPIGVPRKNPDPNDEASPLFLAKGYAVAASRYSAQGWAVREAIADNEALLRHFSAKYGKPKHTHLVGFSMGGLVALASLERLPNPYSGALSLCGINTSASTAFQDSVITSLVSFDYFFPGIIPKLDNTGAPPVADRDAIERALTSNKNVAKLLTKRLDVPRDGLASYINLNYFILKQTQAKFGGFPVDNRAVAYRGFGDDVRFNSRVKRYAGNPKSITELNASASLSGNISKPVVLRLSQHDQTLPARLSSPYLEQVQRSGKSRYLTVLPPAGEGHCGFSPLEIEQSFDKLIQAESH